MRLLLRFVALLLLFSVIQPVYAQSGDPSEMFLNAYMAVQQGEKLERTGQNSAALSKLRYSASLLDQIATNFPDWQPLIVDYRRKKTADAISRLEESIALEGPGISEPAESPDLEGPLPGYEEPTMPDVVTGEDRSLPAPGGNVDILEQATQNIRSRMKNLETEVARQREQIDALRRDKQELLGRLGNALEKVDVARTTEAEMKAELAQTRASLENALTDASRGAEKTALEERVAKLTEALEQARDERDVADEFARDLRERIGKVHTESEKRIAAVEVERDQALEALEKSKKAQEQVDKLMEENATLLAKLEEAETSIRQFKEEMPEKDKEIAQLRNEMAAAKEMLAKAQEESKGYQSSMADLRAQLEAANKQLADLKEGGTAQPEEIAELTKENTLLRGIVLRQLKEQARRDQAKKLVLAELGKLEGKSDVLMNQLEYLGQPLVKLSKEERALFKDPQIELPEIADSSAMEISIAAPKTTDQVESTTEGSETTLASFGMPGSSLGDSPLPRVPSDSSATETGGSPQVETSLLPNVPEDLIPLAHEAREFFDRGQYREAEKTYEKMLAQAPNNVYVLSNLGVVRFRSGKLRQAEEAFRKAIEVDPKDSFSRCTLGIVYYQQGKYDEAIDELTKALTVDPKNATAHNYLGITASQKGWHEAAQKEMETAIALDPNYADAYFNLAVIHATAQPPNREAARKYYEKALSLGAKPDPALASLLN